MHTKWIHPKFTMKFLQGLHVDNLQIFLQWKISYNPKSNHIHWLQTQKFVSIFSIKVSKEFIKKQKGLQQSYKILYVMTMLHDTRNHPLTLQRVVFENICNSPFVWSKISSKIAWGFKNNFKSHIFLFN